jgi:hypothetical protein
MKNTKKPAKKDKPKTKAQASPKKAAPGQELSEDQLEHVAGGAYDAYMKVDTAGITNTEFKVITKD